MTLGEAADLCEPLMDHLGNMQCRGQFSRPLGEAPWFHPAPISLWLRGHCVHVIGVDSQLTEVKAVPPDDVGGP